MRISLVYVTTSTLEEARLIGRGLLERRLAACVNMVAPMHSVYWWEGSIQEGQEAILLAKTRAELVPELMAEVKRLHSYEVPCMLVFPVEDGHPPFLAWLLAETNAGETASGG